MTARELFEQYVHASGLPKETGFDAWSFGDSKELADKLSALVLDGPKRATAGLLAAFDAEDEPIPRVGAFSVVLDGAGEPVCVIRTIEVRIGPFGSVDAAFAWDEGEGDRSLAWWIDAHRAFFRRECEALGISWQESLEVVFERFELVWPRPVASG